MVNCMLRYDVCDADFSFVDIRYRMLRWSGTSWVMTVHDRDGRCLDVVGDASDLVDWLYRRSSSSQVRCLLADMFRGVRYVS